MKIYKYIYDGKKIEIKSFDCILSATKAGYVTMDNYQKWISKAEIEILKRDHKMWSLRKDKVDLFIDLLKANNNKKVTQFQRNIEILNEENDFLEGLKINDNQGYSR
jgi:hypothetical protein